MRKILIVAAGLAGLAAFTLAGDPAQAQALTAGTLDTLVNAFSRVQALESGLLSAAQDLFLVLAAIQVVWVVGSRVRGGSDMMEILGVLLEQAVVLGFFWWVLINAGPMSRAIVDSFAQAANDASVAAGGSRNMSPSDTFGVGMNMAKTIWEGLHILDPGKSFLLVIGGFLVVGSFAALCALQIEVIIESKIIASMTVLFMGFGGGFWTRDIAISLLRACIAVGAKRLMIQVLIGLTELMMRDLSAMARSGVTIDTNVLIVMVGVPIVLAYLCKTLPARTQAILNGAHVGGAGLGSHASGAAAASVAAAAAMAGVGAAATAAFREASAQMEARDNAAASQSGGQGGSSTQSSRIGRAAQITGGAAKNMAKALGNDVGQRLAGNYAANHGSTGFRMAQAMNARATSSAQQAGRAGSNASSSGTTGTGSTSGSASGTSASTGTNNQP